MKKTYSTLMVLALMIAALGFTACGDDDEKEGGETSSALVGTWDAVSSRFYDDDGWEEFEEENGYWVFTNDKVTIYDEEDLFNGETFKYSFDGSRLNISGMPVWTVITLTNSKMVLKAPIIDGYQELTLRKRGDSGDINQTSISVNLQQAGTLSSKIVKAQASNLIKLKISGHMDARDFDYIKWDCMKIEEVDLSGVVIDNYYGKEGTQEGELVNYAANEIPSGAFFYWQNVHKYVYDGMPIDEGMASLKKITLPKGIKAIRRNAFARAYNLKEINIPEGVETIDYVAFAICTSLEEIKLPSTLKTIGKQAFASMDNLKRINISATTPPSAQSDSFDGKPNTVLYVPKGTETSYKNADGWNSFKSIIGF